MSNQDPQDHQPQTGELIRTNATQKVMVGAALDSGPVPGAASGMRSRLRKPGDPAPSPIIQNLIPTPELAHAEGQFLRREGAESQLAQRAGAVSPGALPWPPQDSSSGADSTSEAFERQLRKRMESIREENEKLGQAVSHLESGLSR